MTLLDSSIFFAVSFVAAAVNSVAGGGTFLTFPVFILNGLTGTQANIMSTIALWPGVLASSFGYRKELEADKKLLLPFLAIGLTGGALGASWFLHTPETVFESLVPWLLLVATLIFTFGPSAIRYVRSRRPAGAPPSTHWLAKRLAVAAGACVIAVYGGYFGAGIGILTLAMLQLMGQTNIHKMNALKTVLTGAINALTAVIFILSGKVLWSLAGVMVSGAVLGGYCGARMALKVSPEKLRWLVSAIGFAMSGYFFFHGV